MQKDLINYLILQEKQKQNMQNLYDSNVKDMNTYFKISMEKEKTDMTLGFTAPFYNTKADRLANHKNNTNE
jgi:hypothetical protein